MLWSRILAATALAAGLVASPTALAAPIASNEGSGTISVIDTGTDKVVATLKFGNRPSGIALSPFAFFATTGESSLGERS